LKWQNQFSWHYLLDANLQTSFIIQNCSEIPVGFSSQGCQMQVASLPQVKSFISYRCIADISSQLLNQILAFSVLTLLIGWQEGQKNLFEWWGAGMVICLEQGADLHMAQLMPLPLTAFCFSKM